MVEQKGKAKPAAGAKGKAPAAGKAKPQPPGKGKVKPAAAKAKVAKSPAAAQKAVAEKKPKVQSAAKRKAAAAAKAKAAAAHADKLKRVAKIREQRAANEKVKAAEREKARQELLSRPKPVDTRFEGKKRAKEARAKFIENKPVNENPIKPRIKEGRQRNYKLPCGVYRFGRGALYHKKAMYKKVQHGDRPRKPAEKPPLKMKVKPIGGEKNGSFRIVRIKKMPKFYAAQVKPKSKRTKKLTNNAVCKRKPRLRSSLTPGTVCILLAGQHKGKRVIFLKQLESGLCLISGPYTINGCPLRRVNQIYLIATSSKVDMTDFQLPKEVNDKFFARIKEKKSKKDDGDIFETKKEKTGPSEEKRAAQKTVDRQLMKAIAKRKDKRLFTSYLWHKFGLQGDRYAHAIKF